MERYFVFLRPLASDFPDKGMKWEAQSAEEMGKEYYPLMGLGKSRPSGLRKTKYLSNSLAHRTRWLRSEFNWGGISSFLGGEGEGWPGTHRISIGQKKT